MKKPVGRRTLVCPIFVAVLVIGGCQADPRIDDIDPKASLLAVGDTGRPHNWPAPFFEGQIAVANGMAAEDRRHPIGAMVLLGDNFYDEGLVRETMPDQISQNLAYPYCRFVASDGPRFDEIAEACPDPLDSKPPRPILGVIGNHDLVTPGSFELQCQEVQEFVSNWDMPCGFSKVVDLDGGLSVILFNSEKRPTKAQIDELTSSIQKSKGPWRVLASHRPIVMNDDSEPMEHGGWIEKMVKASGKQVHAFVSGHHHNLQLFETPGLGPSLQAVVGSGARARARPPDAVRHPQRRYGESRLGFARIDVADSEDEERLYLSLFATPRFPILATGHPELVARWSVGHNGDTRDELTGADASNP